MEAKAVDADAVFKVFTACPDDPKTLLLDVRPQKQFKKGHINSAYNPRLATNGDFLADYSQSSYSLPWSQDCWWGRPVIVYGPPSLSKDHPIIKFLSTQQRCRSLHYFKAGYEAFEAKFPFLCTTSVKANSFKKYPSVILPGFLFLGDWADAEQHERLREIKIKRIITVHNHPERLKLLPGCQHLKIELPDTETADISSHFNACFEFMAEAERLRQAVLVHCGAGVSRSACIVMMFLMRSRLWSAHECRERCIAARSLVCPNDGFWRLLCALEGPLGILKRSDPNATQGFAGADAPAVTLDAEAAGQPVQVRILSLRELQQVEEAAAKAKALAAAPAAPQGAGDKQQPKPLQRGHSRSRSRGRRSSSSSSSSSGSDSSRSRSRSRSRDKLRRGGKRSRSRSRDGDAHKRRRSRSRSRSADRGRAAGGEQRQRGSRWPPQAAPTEAAGAAAAAAAGDGQEPPVPQQSGYLLKLEVRKPEGVVGQLLLGPMKPVVQRVIFGRAPASANVVLEHLSISRQHAQLTVDPAGGVALMDLGSAHGTKLNDAWLGAKKQRSATVGSQFQFGASTRTYKLLEVIKT